MIDTILFDFDGTVMDTNDVIIQSWQHTFRTLRGEEASTEEILATFGETLDFSMENFFPEVSLDVSLPIYRGYQRDNFLSSIHLVPGIRELLDGLMERGYDMSLVTSRLRYTTDQALEEFDLGKYFKHVITADDVTRPKPDPQAVDMALEAMGSGREKALMIGDTIHDILCARNAGVVSVLVDWSITLGGSNIDDFEEDQRPDYIIRSPGELMDLLEELNEGPAR